jgi:hypothetical protein
VKPETLQRMRRPRPKGRQAFENRIVKFERDLTLLKWMLGFNLALTVAVVARLLLGAVVDAIFYGGLIAMVCAAIWGHMDSHPAVIHGKRSASKCRRLCLPAPTR